MNSECYLPSVVRKMQLGDVLLIMTTRRDQEGLIIRKNENLFTFILHKQDCVDAILVLCLISMQHN